LSTEEVLDEPRRILALLGLERADEEPYRRVDEEGDRPEEEGRDPDPDERQTPPAGARQARPDGVDAFSCRCQLELL